MKLSISVPDDMWEMARTIQPDFGPSEIVQEAVDYWLKTKYEARMHVTKHLIFKNDEDAVVMVNLLFEKESKND